MAYPGVKRRRETSVSDTAQQVTMAVLMMDAPAARTMAHPAGEPSDQEAAARTLAGDTGAFETLVLRYERPIYNHLLRMVRRPEDAEDLTQETFLNALRGLAGYKPGQPFRPWLYRIATNAAITALRRRGPLLVSLEESAEQGYEPAEPLAETPAEKLGREQMMAQLEAAVASLPAESAALIHLRYREGMTFEEIGGICGRKPGTVAVALHRLRERLRKLVFCAGVEEQGVSKR